MNFRKKLIALCLAYVAGLAFFLVGKPCLAAAIETPSGQIALDTPDVLRGKFVEDRQLQGLDDPLHMTGHFVLAPAHGLIWGMERPMQTSTIVTPNGMLQDMGGISMKLPVKNFRHLYDMIGGALAGDWNALAADFVARQTGNASHWQMLLTPRPDSPHKISYSTIKVSGGRYVESIAMVKLDGTTDVFSFTDLKKTTAPLPAEELAAFNKTIQ